MIEQEFIDIPDMILSLKMKDIMECVDIPDMILLLKINKPGPALVGAISKAQNSKRTSKCQITVLENRKKSAMERASGNYPFVC